jgi:hypothetical protein
MTGIGPTDQRPHAAQAPTPGAEPAAAESPSPAIERLKRFNAANMVRSLLPLVVICLLLAGWMAFRQGPDRSDPVREVDPTSAVRTAAERADYELLAPAGLGGGYRPTSARTDAGSAAPGDPVTLEIGYLTPSEEFAGFAVSDDRGAEPLLDVLRGAEDAGTVELAGRSWTRSTTGRGETALSLRLGEVTVVVTGSAPDEELAEVAASVRPYAG